MDLFTKQKRLTDLENEFMAMREKGVGRNRLRVWD